MSDISNLIGKLEFIRDYECKTEPEVEAMNEAVTELSRSIPAKPLEATDKVWGIPHRQAVCPNCDCFLGTVHFLCDDENAKRKVTYCETCGQAIDWEGWDFDG